MNRIIKITSDYFLKGDERSILAKKNVFLTFIIKSISLPISFILIPLTINYVNTDSYGIWITISSIVAWMSFFDIGISNGLRNKLTESLAEGNTILAKKYVSTTYAVLSIFSFAVLLLFVGINFFLDWSLILNTSSRLSLELSKVALIVVGYFSFKFVLSTINIILMSKQLPAEASLRSLLEQLSSLIVIFLLTKFTSGSLLNLALGLCIAPLLVLFYYNFVLFFGKLKNISPSLPYVDFSLTKDLMSIGFKFFIIQIAGIIQFQTANFIIIQAFGPNDVTTYNIVFKYFSVLTMLMAILMVPLWSAVTDAYAKRDTGWIIRAERKYRKMALSLATLGILMLVFSNHMYDLWLGKGKIVVSFQTSFWMFLFTIITLFGSIYCTILNGISALNIQYKASLVSPIVFLASSYFFIKFMHWGINAIIISSLLANFNAYLLAPIEYRRIFYFKR